MDKSNIEIDILWFNFDKFENYSQKLSKISIWNKIRIFFPTCTADSRLELALLGASEEDLTISWAPGVSFIIFKYSTSLKTFLSPPPGLCLTLSRDPTLLWTFNWIFRFSIWKQMVKTKMSKWMCYKKIVNSLHTFYRKIHTPHSAKKLKIDQKVTWKCLEWLNVQKKVESTVTAPIFI